MKFNNLFKKKCIKILKYSTYIYIIVMSSKNHDCFSDEYITNSDSSSEDKKHSKYHKKNTKNVVKNVMIK